MVVSPGDGVAVFECSLNQIRNEIGFGANCNTLALANCNRQAGLDGGDEVCTFTFVYRRSCVLPLLSLSESIDRMRKLLLDFFPDLINVCWSSHSNGGKWAPLLAYSYH
jgi:hypothetical protein